MNNAMINESTLREKVRSVLSETRFRHVSGVVEAADMLAKRYGADPVKARLAA